MKKGEGGGDLGSESKNQNKERGGLHETQRKRPTKVDGRFRGKVVG